MFSNLSGEDFESREEPAVEDRLSLPEQLVRVLVVVLAVAYSFILLN